MPATVQPPEWMAAGEASAMKTSPANPAAPNPTPPGGDVAGVDSAAPAGSVAPDPVKGVGYRPLYADYFGCTEAPFAIAPDPHYLYMSRQHQEALAHLLYGIQGDGGFVLLTGEVGTGKTTVCRCFLEQLPDGCDVALILNPKLDARDMLLTIREELSLAHPLPAEASNKALIDGINRHLLASYAAGRTTVLIIDEAQNLSLEVLEQVRLLTNLETNKRKLLQVIMIGQPELRQVLARPELNQLAQRITARSHLGPLDQAETARYIRHRLMIAGYRGPGFPPWSLRRIHRLSGGIPRLINVICDRTLLGTYVEGHWLVSRKILAQAAREVFGGPAPRRHGRPLPRWLTRWHPSVPALLPLAIMMAVGLVAFSAGNWERLRGMVRSRQGGLHGDVSAPSAADGPIAPQTRAHAPSPVQPPAAGFRTEPQTPAPARFDWTNVAPEAIATAETVGYVALFQRWGVPVTGTIMDPCLKAQAEGLQCLQGRASWADLVACDRPALLEVQAGDGPSFPLALLEVGADEALVMLGGQPFRTSVADLQEHWSGGYLLFWKPPPGYQRELRKGDHGSMVAWLIARLELARASSLGATDPFLFDDRVEAAVLAFQQSLGLVADGIVGPRTLIRLNTATEQRVPLLNQELKGQSHVIHSQGAEAG